MADVCEVTEKMKEEWEAWKQGRPQVVLDLAERFPPWKLFRLKSSGHRVTVLSYNEGGTMTVSVDGRYNRVLFSRQVFGVEPGDLEECELPLPGEDVGDTAAEAGYTDKDVKEILIPMLRKRGHSGDCGCPDCMLGKTAENIEKKR